MLQKVICKARRSISGNNKPQEFVVKCGSKGEVLKALSGYLMPGGGKETVPAQHLFDLFDPTRPTRVVEVTNAAGVTDSISVHTLH